MKLDDVAATFKYDKLDDFLAAVGYGDIHPHQIAMRISQRDASRARSGGGAGAQAGLGAEPQRHSRARRWRPADAAGEVLQPGPRRRDHRLHHARQGRHGPPAACPSVVNEEDQERLVQVDWGRTEQQMFPITVRVEAWDRVGLARDVAALLADEGLSMTAQTAVVHKDQTATVWATVEVGGLDKLSRVLHRLEGIKDVFSVVREVGKRRQRPT